MRAESTAEATASPRSLRSPTTKRPVPVKLFELRDLYRIPLWFLAKPVYAFAPIPVFFRLAGLRGTLDSLWSPYRAMVAGGLERYLGETTSRRERRRIARRHFQFRAKGRFTTVWPQFRDFAGAEAIPIDGLEHLDAALERGKGAILATGHFGFARMVKPILRSRGRSVLLVGPARRPTTRDLHPHLSRLGSLVHTKLLRLPRASLFDARWHGAAGNDLSTGLNLRPLLTSLERNETLVILADGRAAQALYRVPVGGVDVYFAPGSVSLARQTGAALLPTFVVDEPERKGPSTLRLVICPPLDLQVTNDRNADLEANLRRFASVYEQQMRSHPHNFHWSWVRDGVLDRPN